MQFPGRHWVRMGAVGRPPRLGVTILLVLLLSSWSVTAVTATPYQQGTVTVAVVPADISKAAGEKFEVKIEISNVKDLGAFELSLRFDPALIQVDKATIGDFIGSTDRTVLPLGPNINVAEGRLDVGALSTGALPGAQGKGVLLALSCTAMRAGQGQLDLAQVRLSDTKGQPIAATPSGGNVTFTGDVLVPTATAAPVTPTATLVPLPATATLIPTATAVPPSPTAVATATMPPTETPAPAGATPAVTPEPVETRLFKAVSATTQALQTAAALWTETPTATVTLEPTATSEPGSTPNPEAMVEPGATSSSTLLPSAAPAATPAEPNAPGSQPGAGLAIGLGVVAVALGAGGVVLWRRGRAKSS